MSCPAYPSLEALFVALDQGDLGARAHLSECAACGAIVEAHRQLEKDLHRIVDPMPPLDFVQQVMAKVALAPASARTELWTGLTILAAGLLLAVSLTGFDAAALGELGTRVASGVVWLRSVLIAVGSGLSVLWQTAALPLATALLLMLFSTLFGLRRLAGAPLADSQVSP